MANSKHKNTKNSMALSGDTLTIYALDHPSCVTNFVRAVNRAKNRDIKTIKISFKCERSSIFPNACLPIAGIINNFEELFGIDCEVSIGDCSYLKQCCFVRPLDLSVEELKHIKNPLDKVFKYSSDELKEGQIAQLTQNYIDYISKTKQCSEGVLDSLMWCINEVMDNVLVHSGESSGYIMAQYHKNRQYLTICVYDYGMGIYNSLRNSMHSPSTEIDSLTMAILEGVGDGNGQGNGLFGLYQIVAENEGQLTISSGNSENMLKKGELKKYKKGSFISNGHECTLVDFRLDLSKKIDIKSALKSIGGIDGFDIRIDNMWQERSNCYLDDVFEHCAGTGTREAGRELRNDVVNILTKTHEPIVLDFSNVRACSSSFIDEFLGKMIIDLGIIKFNASIKIININEFISHLFNRSIAMRFHQSWEKLK